MSDLHRTASSGLFAVMGLSLESIDHYLSSGASLIAIVAGAAPIQALDTNLAPWMHPKVARAAKLATPQA